MAGALAQLALPCVMTTAAFLLHANLLKWIISSHRLLVLAEIQGKLKAWLWLPCDAAGIEPSCVGVRDP
jgi:hypothetical protein